MNLGWPQTIYICWVVADLTVHACGLVVQGNSKAVPEEQFNKAASAFVGKVIARVLVIGLLWWGGFFGGAK